MNVSMISVSDKRGIVNFAKFLNEMGIEILSSGGTSKYLKKNGVFVKEISEYTKFPEMLDGRVKTLHPLIHGGILADRDNPKHLKELEQRGIIPIDMVVVNLYPFDPKRTQFEIDIGGSALIRAAAKNYEHVAVVVNPNYYPSIINELKERGDLSLDTKRKLAIEAFEYTANYDYMIYNYFQTDKSIFPQIMPLKYEKFQNLRYGENPHQNAALYFTEGFSPLRQLHGPLLSFNNLNDVNAALETMSEFEEPVAVVIKHTNPCGVACDKILSHAYINARASDPLSAYGGVVGVNKIIDLETAKEITSTFVEVIAAPGYTEESLSILRQKPNLHILEYDEKFQFPPISIKEIIGGVLVQERDTEKIKPGKLQIVTSQTPTEEELTSLLFAWKVCRHVKSNAIVLAQKEYTVGIGAGQMSRIDSVELAIKKAGERSKKSVMASDGFFPFRDSIDIAAEAGITAVIQPGGSKRDKQVIEAANECGMKMVFTGVRCFLH